MRNLRRSAAKFLLATTFVFAYAIASPQVLSAQSECRKTLEEDVAACISQKDECFNDPDWSWWTSTCNLEYVLCVDTATLLYLYCGA